MKFTIGISEECFKNIQKTGVETVQRDNIKNVENFRILKSDMLIGSYDRHISIYCPSEEVANIEFSLPKYLFGENIHMINSDQVVEIVGKVYRDFSSKFGSIQPFNDWIIKRLDLCYVWKLSGKKEEAQILLVLKSLEYLNKTKKHLYDTSVMWTGQAYSFKYYLKRPEFLRNDFKQLEKENKINLAHKLLKEAEHILRFEITFRSARVKTLLGSSSPKFGDLVNGNKPLEDLVFETLDYYQKRIFKVNPKIQNKVNTFDLLRNKYGKIKARRLEEFWNMYQSDNVSKARIKDNYSSSQLWRISRDLRDAGIGISSSISIDLSIDKNKLLAKVAR